MATASVLLALTATFVKSAVLVLKEKIVAVRAFIAQNIPLQDVIAIQVITFLKTNFKMPVNNNI